MVGNLKEEIDIYIYPTSFCLIKASFDIAEDKHVLCAKLKCDPLCEFATQSYTGRGWM